MLFVYGFLSGGIVAMIYHLAIINDIAKVESVLSKLKLKAKSLKF